MISYPKVLIVDLENVFFPAEELYQDALNLAFADVTKGKVRFDKNNIKSILLGNSFLDIVEFAASFKPKRSRITEVEREFILTKFIEYTEKFLIKGKTAGTKTEHLDILKWFAATEIPIVFCSNLSYEITMKYLDATGYAPFADLVMTPDHMKNEYNGFGYPKPSKEMYVKILSIYGVKDEEALCIEGTLGGVTAAKFAHINFISCKDHKLFKLSDIKKALESMELISYQ